MTRASLRKPVESKVEIRPARESDLPVLVEIERICFQIDRLTRRSFQRIMRRGHAVMLVAELEGRVVGYALVFFHAGTSLARLYSMAVLPQCRGRGIGRALLAAAEQAARNQGRVYLRLEVHRDNAKAIRLYEDAGYRQFTVWPDYYEDHAEALRYEKRILHVTPAHTSRVPFYAQTTDFTCGPAALMMAMKALRPSLPLDRRLELQLWREATTIFMTSGHGGCSPPGLALAAKKRGFDVELYINQKGPLFLDSVRQPQKREILKLVHEDFEAQIRKTEIPVHDWPRESGLLTSLIDQRRIPIVLTSSYRITHRKSPHFMVLTGYDSRFIFAHDPDVDTALHKSEMDCMNVPIPIHDFEAIARYGRSRLQAMVVVGAGKTR